MSNFLLYVIFPFLCLLSGMLEVGREPAARLTCVQMLDPSINHSGSQSKTQKQQEMAKGCVMVLHMSPEGEEAFPERPTQTRGTAIQ